MQRLVDAAAPLQQGREERPGTQFGDLYLDIPGGGRHRFGAVPVALSGPALDSLVAVGTDRIGGFGLDQRLQPGPDQLGKHRPGVSGLERIELSEQGRMVVGHRVVCPLLESLWSVTQ
ncbi:hypothetical protein MALGJ_07690 [Mycolicibacter algericus]|uniref:Uncharacterized protein n=1 Tax=Mycolicibacter algericus TaxID=1288388 RepID=A0A7I9Y6I2_MYCAL|nr:hypothetical protein MALGJ_07690 [Mycolicibacter algericus]